MYFARLGVSLCVYCMIRHHIESKVSTPIVYGSIQIIFHQPIENNVMHNGQMVL